MAIVECEEAVDRQLSPEVVVLPAEHLFTYTGTNLRLEVKNGAESEVKTFITLVVLRVLDLASTTKCVHPGRPF